MRAEVVLVGARLRMKERYVRRCGVQHGGVGVMMRRADEVAAIDEEEEDEEDDVAAAAPKLGGRRHFVMLGYMLAYGAQR